MLLRLESRVSSLICPSLSLSSLAIFFIKVRFFSLIISLPFLGFRVFLVIFVLDFWVFGFVIFGFFFLKFWFVLPLLGFMGFFFFLVFGFFFSVIFVLPLLIFDFCSSIINF